MRRVHYNHYLLWETLRSSGMNKRQEAGYRLERKRKTPRSKRRRQPPLPFAPPSSLCVWQRRTAGRTASLPPLPRYPSRRPPLPPGVALPPRPSATGRAGGPEPHLPTRRRRLTGPLAAPLPAQSEGAGCSGALPQPPPRGGPQRRRPTPRHRRPPGCAPRTTPGCHSLSPPPPTPCRCVSPGGGVERAARQRRRARRRRAAVAASRLAAARGRRRHVAATAPSLVLAAATCGPAAARRGSRRRRGVGAAAVWHPQAAPVGVTGEGGPARRLRTTLAAHRPADGHCRSRPAIGRWRLAARGCRRRPDPAVGRRGAAPGSLPVARGRTRRARRRGAAPCRRRRLPPDLGGLDAGGAAPPHSRPPPLGFSFLGRGRGRAASPRCSLPLHRPVAARRARRRWRRTLARWRRAEVCARPGGRRGWPSGATLHRCRRPRRYPTPRGAGSALPLRPRPRILRRGAHRKLGGGRAARPCRQARRRRAAVAARHLAEVRGPGPRVAASAAAASITIGPAGAAPDVGATRAGAHLPPPPPPPGGGMAAAAAVAAAPPTNRWPQMPQRSAPPETPATQATSPRRHGARLQYHHPQKWPQ